MSKNYLPNSESSITLIIPYFNEVLLFEQFFELLESFIKIEIIKLFKIVQIVIIDDGSVKPLRVNLKSDLPSNLRIYTIRHKINLGQGAALQTGIEYAREQFKSDLYVTLDSDGQHSPEDLISLINTINSTNADIIFGTRHSKNNNTTATNHAPLSRRLILKAAIIFENFLSGVKTTDAHNGYRIFNKNFANKLELKQSKMAHATEFKLFVKKYKFKFAECPVRVVYSTESLKKGQKNSGAFLIIRDLLRMFIFDRG